MVRTVTDSTGEDAVLAATGHDRAYWFELLDAHGAASLGHTAIARWLHSEQGVDGWWAQNLTVAYEQARGLRQPGQMADGSFSIAVSKTVALEPGEALDALVARLSAEFGAPIGQSRSARYPTVRFAADAGRIVAGSAPAKSGKTALSLTWEKLPGGEDLEARKSRLRELLQQAVAIDAD